jgi:hypothetical protein
MEIERAGHGVGSRVSDFHLILMPLKEFLEVAAEGHVVVNDQKSQ